MSSIWLSALLGAVFFGVFGGATGMALGAAAGAVFGLTRQHGLLKAQVAELTGRLEALDARLERLPTGSAAAQLRAEAESPVVQPSAEAEPAAAATGPTRADTASPDAAADRTPAESTAVPSGPAPAGVGAGPRAEPAAGRPEAMPAEAPPRRPSFLAPAWSAARDFLTTGNVVARVGVVILFFGLAFLLKYAADHELVPIELRLAGVAALGVALLVGGWKLRERAGFGLILQGAGVGTLYLTTFAALRLYGLVPEALAFGLMVALVGLSAWLALLQDSRALAVIGTLGGFLAPVLASSGEGSHVVLFSYYAVLNLGVFAIAWQRAWRALNLLGFVFTFVIGAAWGSLSYRPELFATTQPFLALFFLLYLGVAVLSATRHAPELKGYVDGPLVFALPLVVFALQAQLVRPFEFGVAISALVIGGVYVGAATLLWRRRVAGIRVLTEAFLALGVVFATVAIPLALEGQWTAAAWALEGAALVWVGVRQQRLLARAGGMLLQLGAGVVMLGAWRPLTDGLPFLNGQYLAAALVGLASLFSAFYLDRHASGLRREEPFAARLLLGWGLLWWAGAGTAELSERLPHAHSLNGAVVFLTLSALALDRAADRLRWTAAKYPSVALLPTLFVLAWIGIFDLGYAHLFVTWGALAWLLAGAVHLFLLRGREDTWPGWVVRAWHAAGLWFAVGVLAIESAWMVGQLGLDGGGWRLAAWVVVPAVALAWLTAAERPAWPLVPHASVYRRVAPLPIAAGVWVWLVAATFFQGTPAPLPYLPILNPAELAQLGALLVLTQWWLKRFRRAGPAERTSAWVVLAIGFAGFLALNGVLARTVHAYVGVPYAADALYRSLWFQSGMSILWSVLALATMAVATRREHIGAWFVGGGLLGLVIGKLFLIELANTGTVARIVSFVAVGLLMLLIGYLSPMPPRRQSRVAL